MKIASHPYAPNGLRARDEWGNVRCWCGHLRGVHADQGSDPDEAKETKWG